MSKKTKQRFTESQDETIFHFEDISAPNLKNLKIDGEQKTEIDIEFGSEKRIHPRFSCEFDVILYVHNKLFRSRTLNISKSGALLKDVVPKDFMRRVVDIVILPIGPHAAKYQRLHFTASMIGGVSYPTARLTFINSASTRYTFEDLEKVISTAA